jgi:ribosomal protein S18 acetylase RimI-like enzyme
MRGGRKDGGGDPGGAFTVRPMTLEDAADVAAVVEESNADADRRAGQEVREHTPEERRWFTRCMARFASRDPEGAWVAVDGAGGVVGMAEAIRRHDFWGLSMLFVDPAWQSRGVGRSLLEHALRSAQGASLRMIVSSSDPRAMRRYWAAGLTMHPAVGAAGAVGPGTVPTDLPGRGGSTDDLDLVAEVDAGLRGPRDEDVAFLLSVGAELDVVDGPRRRGYALRRDGRLQMLGATDEETAKLLVWRYLATVDATATLFNVTSAQSWAVDVAMAAGLTVQPRGALFVDGMEQLPGPWLPSGWFF